MAPPIDPPTTITVRIKVPPGHLQGSADEFTLGSDIAVASKVGSIRDRIQQAIPSNPPPERQRLLYAGRALVDNEQTLADALNIRRDPTQTQYVVHLLVKGEGANTTPHASRLSASIPGRSATASPAQHTSNQAPQHALPAHAPQEPAHVNVAQHQNMHNRMVAALAQQQQAQLMMAHGHHFPPHFPPMAQNIPNHGPGGPHHLLNLHGPLGAPQQQQQPPHGHAQPHAAPTSQIETPREPRTGGPVGPQHAETSPPQQRSASQPPPRQQNGVIVNGTGIGPNGERITFHQHTMHFPNQPPPLGMPWPSLSALPGMPPQNSGRRVNALDQARENIAEMQRILIEMRGQDDATEEQRERVDQLGNRMGALNDYIDPFQLGTVNDSGPQRFGSALQQRPESIFDTINHPPPSQPAYQGVSNQTPAASPADVTCYLLSSPAGPQAILYSPQHGTYTSTPQPVPVPTPTTQPQASRLGQVDGAQDAMAPPNAQNNAPNARPPAAPAAAVQPGGPLEPLFNHMWLLLRVLIFSYFLLGANMGWRRPLALLAIGAGFWLIRQGLLGDGGALRRWWENIINDARPQQPAAAAGQPGQQPGQAQAGNARPGRMPTPAEVAERLLNEDRNQRDQRVNWLREQIRPLERAVALLVASLWPGVGEAYVRAREEEERRRNEEEIAARRRVEEERQQLENEKKKAEEEKAGASEAFPEAREAEGVASTSAVETVDGQDGLRERTASHEQTSSG